jgi:hypothetical protein
MAAAARHVIGRRFAADLVLATQVGGAHRHRAMHRQVMHDTGGQPPGGTAQVPISVVATIKPRIAKTSCARSWLCAPVDMPGANSLAAAMTVRSTSG